MGERLKPYACRDDVRDGRKMARITSTATDSNSVAKRFTSNQINPEKKVDGI